MLNWELVANFVMISLKTNFSGAHDFSKRECRSMKTVKGYQLCNARELLTHFIFQTSGGGGNVKENRSRFFSNLGIPIFCSVKQAEYAAKNAA